MATDHPFTPACSRAAFLATPACGEILRRLDEGLGDREPFLVVTGEPGTGKTTLAGEVIARWGELVAPAFLTYSSVSEVELLEEIVRRFGLDPPEGGSRSRLVAAFERALAAVAERGQIALLVVDDAHGLGVRELEALRLLANAAQRSGHPLEILLLGLPALDARLDDAALATLRQRIAVRAKLAPLATPDVRRYLQHRVGASGGDGVATFPKKTCREIAARTGGLPRRINVLAAESLRVARAWGDDSVGVEHVQTAAASLGGFIPVSLPDEADPGEDLPAVRVLPAKGETALAPAANAPAVNAAAKATTAPGANAAAPAATPAPMGEKIGPTPIAKAAHHATAAKPAHDAPIVKPGQDAPAAKPAHERPVAKPVGAPPVAKPPATAPSSSPAAKAAPASPPVGAPPIPPTEAAEEPVVIMPSAAKQDPQEWIARFVGDKGPLQIGSRSGPEDPWVDPMLFEPSADESGEAPRPRVRAAAPRSPRRHRPRLAPVVLALLVLVLALVLLVRVGMLARQSAARAPGRASGGVKTSSVERAAPAVPVLRTAPAAPSPTAPVAASGPATSSPDEPAALPAARRYTIEVANGLDQDTALAERDRLAALTGIRGWVIAPEDAGGRYRVVLGIFKAAERAQGAAHMLVTSRTLPDATVIPMPAPRLRQ